MVKVRLLWIHVQTSGFSPVVHYNKRKKFTVSGLTLALRNSIEAHSLIRNTLKNLVRLWKSPFPKNPQIQKSGSNNDHKTPLGDRNS